MKTELLSIWGSITGTIAILLQIRQWIHDRPKLKVSAHMVVRSESNSDPDPVYLEVRAVNLGRRAVRITEVATMHHIQDIGDAPFDIKKAELTHIIFRSGIDEKPLELNTDGDEHIWQSTVFLNTRFLVKRTPKGDFGKVYVNLANGKRVFCKFLVLPTSEWPKRKMLV
jgi:hypothetical protein